MMAKALAANGAHRIYIVGRRPDVLHSAAASINPKTVVPLPGDVTSRSSLLSIAKHVETETGYINLLICNAGIMGPKPLKAAPGSGPPSLADYAAHALETPMSDFTNTYAVNTTAVYYTSLAFLTLLDAGNNNKNVPVASQIMTTSSIGGFSRLPGASFAYNSSKAAVTHMTKMLATAFVPYGIRCNVLAPGVFPSELAGAIIGALDPARTGELDQSLVPAGRTGREEDIAGAVLWMAGRGGGYLNGSVVVVDGGRLGMLASTY
jgi:NAD(P)-dependent dehydrogenase (short-subunit alcohol dehydrogenase family)